jgi:hypothetical protein
MTGSRLTGRFHINTAERKTDADGLRFLLRAVRFFFSCGFSARINAEFQIE